MVVYLYQQVKEDGILLYGFNLKEEEKDLFLKLISVKGIGCKSACTMLASEMLKEFVRLLKVAI